MAQSPLEKIRLSLARRIINAKVLAQIEGELFKTRGALGRYLLMPGPVLREPEWNFELLKEICDQSFVMEMITRTLTQEVARPGLAIKPRFAAKCIKCQTEYQTKPDACPQCNSTEFRDPSPNERKILEDVLRKPNPEYDWDRMLRSMTEDDLKLGNWWLSLTYQYYLNPETKQIDKKVAEIYVEDPRYIRISADAKAHIRSNQYFCPRCYDAERDSHIVPREEEIASGTVPTCETCNQPLVMTGYTQVVQGRTVARWGVEEIVHGSSTQTLPELYGRPRPLSVWKWLIMLRVMLDYNTEVYSSGYVSGFLVFQGLTQDQVNSIKAQIEKELEAKQVIDITTGELRPSLRIRQAWIGTGAIGEKALKADFIASMPDPAQMQSLEWFKFGIEKVTSVFGVTPVFVSIIESGRAGSNPRMQLDVQNRTIQELQKSLVSALNLQLLSRLKVHDWELEFKDIELRDELRQVQIEELRARAAERWLASGFSVKIDPSTGELVVSGEGKPAVGSLSERTGVAKPAGPEISEASGYVLEKENLPAWAIYLVEPHGRMIWAREKQMILRTRRYLAHENQPLLLVEDNRAYGTITLAEPYQITWTEFGKLEPYHRVTRKEAEEWGWTKYDSLWAYNIKVLSVFKEPLRVDLPRGTQTFIRVASIRFPEGSPTDKAVPSIAVRSSSLSKLAGRPQNRSRDAPRRGSRGTS